MESVEGIDNSGTAHLVLESVSGTRKRPQFQEAVWIWHSLVIYLRQELTVVNNTFSYYFICLVAM